MIAVQSSRWLTSLLLLALHLTHGSTGRAEKKPAVPAMQRYDGHWWQLLSADEREELVNGFVDGALSQGVPATHVVSSAEELTVLYKRQPATARLPLGTVLCTLGRTKPMEAEVQGEHYAGKHGFYNGDYWFQISPKGRLGFVEGYLLATSGSGGRALSRASSTAQAITHWYGFDREGVAAPAAHTPTTPIGDVLAKQQKGP